MKNEIVHAIRVAIRVLFLLLRRVFLPTIFGIVGFAFSMTGVPEGIPKLFWYLVCIILPFCFGYIVNDVLIEIYEKNTLHNDLTSLIHYVKVKFEALSVYYAFHTDNGHLEKILEKSKDIRTRARWLVPAFVSKKLTQEIENDSEIKFKASNLEFAGILQELIPYCSDSIFMTCPYTPYEWFESLLGDSGRFSLAKSGQLTKKDLPEHMRRLLSLKGPHKKRLVVIQDEEELDKLFKADNIRLLDAFMRFSNGKYSIDTRFAYYPAMCGDCKKCNLTKQDIQIWDNSVVIEYKDSICTINLDLSRYHRQLFSSINACFNRECNYPLSEVKGLLKNVKDLHSEKVASVDLKRWKVKLEKDANGLVVTAS